MGTRLGPLTSNKPKCMLDFFGKTIIQRQIETIRGCGISEIIIIKGYKQEKIDYPGVRYFINSDFKNTNMVASLFCAREVLNQDTIVIYGDILFETKLLKKVIKADCDLGVTADINYEEYWIARYGSLSVDSESFVVDVNNNLNEIGSAGCSLEKVNARYIGILKFSSKVLDEIIGIYDNLYTNKIEKAEIIKQMYMTDFLQLLINRGLKVKAINVSRGWLEFDSQEDYELYKKWKSTGELSRYINIFSEF